MNISIEIAKALSIKQRKNHVLGYCPVCDCSDANFFINNRLTWNCWHCSESGRIINDTGEEVDYIEEAQPSKTLDISEIRKIYAECVEEYKKNLSTSIKDYLKSRGLEDSTIDKFKLGFCSRGQNLKIYNDKNAKDAGIIREDRPTLADRLVIPYLFNNEVTDLRGRIIETIGIKYKENTPKYISLEGSYNLRGANYFFNHDIINESDTVIITEGEFKAIVAYQHGFPIVATPDITKCNNEWDDLLKNKKVILAADNEYVIGRRSPCYIQAKFLMKHVPHLRVARFNRNIKSNKTDIDSLILSRGSRELKWAVETSMTVEDFLKIERIHRYGTRR